MNLKILFLSLSLLLILGCSSQQGTLKIGVILPLSGPAAIWGENIRNGMELARIDLEQGGIHTQILYEDSQANAQTGLSAYQKLKNVDNVDVVVSVFSRVSIPLISLADNDKMPLIMTMVSAKGVTEKSPYAFRFYSDETQYTYPHLNKLPKNESLAFLYINDEFGTAVMEATRAKAKELNIAVVAEEPFDPNSADFRTQLIKISAKSPTNILFIGAVPSEVINALKQVRELDLPFKFIEGSPNLAVSSVRSAVKEEAEGTWTIAYAFDIGEADSDFKKNYFEKYGQEPLNPATLGYDLVKLLTKASTGEKMSGYALVNSILQLKSFDSLGGNIPILPNREINPPTYSVKIVNGELVKN